MANVSSDQAAAVSTQFQALYLDGYRRGTEALNAQYQPLIMDETLDDFQGDRINLNWLGAIPVMREWVDERRPQELKPYSWEVKVKRWEATIEIDLDLLKDAKWNAYGRRISNLGFNAPRHRFQLISDLIKNGASSLCYDGQYFFDTDHSEGSSGTQSNKLTGSGADTLAHVTTDYFAAKAALMQFKDDKGEVTWMGDFRPLIWAPAAGPVMQFIETLRTGALSGGGGDTNILKNMFDVVYDPRLTDLTDWYMFNPMADVKPFVSVNREEIHYEDNFGTGNEYVWDKRVGEASVVGRDNMTYAEWRNGVQVVNS